MDPKKTKVPSSEKQLEACSDCGLILTAVQWKERSRADETCPNGCTIDSTPSFSGMISIMAPSSSWVAKWNRKQACLPGIYAMSLKTEEEDEY